MRYLLLAILLFAAVVLHTSPASGCTVCHSKNPKMVRMHEALRFKDCFVCHRPGGIGGKEGLKEQRESDQRCISCHKADTGTSRASPPAP